MAKRATPKSDAGPAGAEPAGPAPEPGFDAVIYVHGIGSQRRFEETSRLIDRLDHFAHKAQEVDTAHGFLTGVRAWVEPSRTESGQTLAYVETVLKSATDPIGLPVRFYELYWAPVLAGEKSATSVIKWVARQVWRPLMTLPSPWRERQRLRRASLAALAERRESGADPISDDEFKALVNAYDSFERLDAQEVHAEGSFDQFLTWLGGAPDADPERLRQIARDWRRSYIREELRNLAALMSAALTLLLLAGAVVAGALVLLRWLAGRTYANPLLQSTIGAIDAGWQSVGMVAVGLFSLIGVQRFLVDYLGDVEAWSTYAETDVKNEGRRKIIDNGRQLFRHVLATHDAEGTELPDENRCRRLTIVAHSLGTTVVHDVLLALARENRARADGDPIAGPLPLLKIDNIVTLGSPIDKIEYFFESYRSRSHRYKRVTEELRGDLGEVPFSRNNKPYVNWINFWDEGDPISGPLHSPVTGKFRPELDVHRIDNIHVASLRFPAPGASHSAYFDSRRVIGTLFAIIYARKHGFRKLPLLKDATGTPSGYDYASARLGPGEPTGGRRHYVLTAAAVPWLLLGGGAALAFAQPWGWWLVGLAVAAMVALYLSAVRSGRAGQTDPL